MAKSYADDLRRKLLQAYDRGEGTLEQLAERFSVSVPWAWKISAQRKRSGQMERIEQRRGTSRKVTLAVQERLIFLDESGVTTQMTRGYARAYGGQRVAEATPQGHWKILTILSALSLRGLLATMTIEEPTDGDIFLAYVEQVLCPEDIPIGGLLD